MPAVFIKRLRLCALGSVCLRQTSGSLCVHTGVFSGQESRCVGFGARGWVAMAGMPLIVLQQFWTFASSPLIEEWGQGSDSRLKRCFCTQAWHHN